MDAGFPADAFRGVGAGPAGFSYTTWCGSFCSDLALLNKILNFITNAKNSSN